MFPYYIRVTFILIRRSVCRSVGVSLRLSFLCLSCVPVSTFVCLSLRHLFPPVCPSVYLPISLTVCPYVSPFVCLYVCPCVCLSTVRLSACQSMVRLCPALSLSLFVVPWSFPSIFFASSLFALLRSIFRLLLLPNFFETYCYSFFFLSLFAHQKHFSSRKWTSLLSSARLLWTKISKQLKKSSRKPCKPSACLESGTA